ncbi:ADP-ribose pyrophosphatase YjhB (NUDIX family) [Nocardia tenerifensis]|uniref:ADP-ribose pyrophosphatase YjhB (NUDIX family) n=1 Tax=Nocardia tenerifensis TaxID=228006 RepID=A0A318K986_9NOCA|nr:NUDIX domain-containing protein [Nocardia tenerifensis]PXX66812.1 ADP-ribose pyrophosphatase YjhB (NUDIX family) [Nocardia tenerifensis]
MGTVIGKVAWIRVENGELLSTRSRGKDAYYVPGGKPEAGEDDIQALLREIDEELSVSLDPNTIELFGVYEAQAHGHAEGVTVRMTCYRADYHGTLAPGNEIEELAWLSYADRHRVSPVDQLILDDLASTGQLRSDPA